MKDIKKTPFITTQNPQDNRFVLGLFFLSLFLCLLLVLAILLRKHLPYIGMSASLTSKRKIDEFSVDQYTVGLWNFDDNVSQTHVFLDESSHKNHLIVTDTSQIKTNKSLHGSALASKVSVNDLSDNFLLQEKNKFTIEAVFKLTGRNGHSIVEKWESFALRIENNSILGVVYQDDLECWNHAVFPLELDRWYYIAFTYNGLTSKLYINGNLISTQKCNGRLRSNKNAIMIGGNLGGGVFEGIIDDLRISNVERSKSEIGNHDH